ncbi:MAG: ABC transporter ATP-binding protein/permease [Lachnospiraceae bacterium]|nr:ABC transporter ATP-binding protein/permease [Lachnospiraceae bacterium]
MYEYYPLIVVGAIVGVFSLILLIAYLTVRDKKQTMGFERQIGDREIMGRLLHYARPYLPQFLLVGAVMLFTIAYDVVSPFIIGRIEELVAGEFRMPQIYRAMTVYVSILLVSMVCAYIQAVVLQKTGQRIISVMREDLFVKIESLSHEQLNEIPVGKLVTRVTNDTNAISMMFTNLLVNFVRNIFAIVGVFAAMLVLSYELTLMILCFVPFIVLFTVIFRKFSRRAYRKVKDCTTDINTYLSENLSGIKITQIFNREEAKMQEFRERSIALGRAKQEQILVFGIFRPLVYMLYVSSILCLLYLGGRGYLENQAFMGQVITSGILVSFYMYISKFYNPIQNLAEQFNWLQSAFASAEKVFTIMDLEPAIQDAPDAVELETMRGEIEFRDVWFSYVEGEWVLKGVSFHVMPRETVAFVGSTGSGKTTILSLICRNYEFQKGEILIDGIDIRKIKTASLRRHFGQMLQDVFLFSGTIRSNIVLRAEGISDAQVREACRYVNADHFIDKLEKGLDEEVRERGNNFSAGQRQLLSFARTIVHKPAVMILDEATANIDTETELLIQNSLEKMQNIGTMLMVAHRLSTIQNADKIIVLSHGKIMEQGTHQELLELHGKYYRLYHLQYRREEMAREKNNAV